MSGSLFAARRRQKWLANTAQLYEHLDRGSLVIDRLSSEEAILSVQLEESEELGRGESAALVLLKRPSSNALFVSSDKKALAVADRMGFQTITLLEVVERWIDLTKPTISQLDELIEGLRDTRFALKSSEEDALRKLAGQ